MLLKIKNKKLVLQSMVWHTFLGKSEGSKQGSYFTIIKYKNIFAWDSKRLKYTAC